MYIDINSKKIIILFLLILILFLIYNIRFTSKKESFTNSKLITMTNLKDSKKKVVVCLFGVIPRSIKYTWDSINKNIVEPLKKNYDVDIYVFNMNIEDTKVDGVKLNQKDIEIIPYDYKEEEIQSSYDKNIITICNKIDCKIHKYTPNTVKNSIRQMYSEYRVGKFLDKNKNKFEGAVICGPDYYILNKININDFKESIAAKDTIFLTQVNNGGYNGYTNGLYFGKIDNLNKMLFRYENLSQYIPTPQDYEHILKKACDDNKLKIKISDIIFYKIRANKKAILQTKPQHIHLIKNYTNIKKQLAQLNFSLNN